MKQLTLSTSGFDKYTKTTRRAVFLSEMQRVVPWAKRAGPLLMLAHQEYSSRPRLRRWC